MIASLLSSRGSRIVLASWVFAGLTFSAGAEQPAIRFQKTQLDAKFRSEGVAVGDFNKDGKADVAAGFVWYEAPQWKMHSIVEQPQAYDPKGYSNSFVNYAEDVNHDGWVDLIVVDFPGTPTWWFENPGSPSKDVVWQRHECTPVSNNESPQYVDVNGDGRRELVMGVAPDPRDTDGAERQMAYLTPNSDPDSQWTIHAISAKGAPGAKRYDHGLGIGDINKDGRNDIVVPQGWWEAPATAGETPWKFHAVDFGKPCAHMYVYDFDGDGDQDLLSSSAHAFGIWWHEQTAPDQWATHEIDGSFSQTHSVCLADINGDGLMDFVTGKRWWAHAQGDPGVNDPAVFYWFELTRVGGRPQWIPHQFDHDSGPGTQFQVADLDGDNLLDIIASNKKGVHIFHQRRD